MNQPKKPGEITFKAKIDDKIAEGVYVNIANIMHNQSEFVVDFGRIVPGRQEFTIHSRVIISPAPAKNLMNALKQNIEKYENTFGEIRSVPAGQDNRKMGF